MSIFGNQAHDAQDASDNNFILAIPFDTDANGYTVDDVSTHFIATGGGLGQAAIYDHDAGNSRPGNLLGSSNSVSLVSNPNHATNNWTTTTLTSGVTLSANTRYWICWNNNTATAEPSYISTGGGPQTPVFKSQTFGTWPNPFGVTGGTTARFTQWLNATVSGGGASSWPSQLALMGAGA